MLHSFVFNYYHCVNIKIISDLSWNLHFGMSSCQVNFPIQTPYLIYVWNKSLLTLEMFLFWPLYLSTPFSEILTYPCLLFLAFLCLVSGQGSMDFTSSVPLAVISFFPPPLKPHVHLHWLYFNKWICFLTGLFTSCNRWVLDSSVSFTALKHRYEGNFALLKTPMSQLTLL